MYNQEDSDFPLATWWESWEAGPKNCNLGFISGSLPLASANNVLN